MSRPERVAAPGPQVDVPWWRLPIVWLVLGGPTVVVIAAIVTAVIAYRGADVVIDTSAHERRASSAPADDALEPAMKARNHAATPR